MSYNGFFILKLESIVFREISLTPLLGTCHDCAQGGRSDHQHSSPGPVSSEQCPHRQWSPHHHQPETTGDAEDLTTLTLPHAVLLNVI